MNFARPDGAPMHLSEPMRERAGINITCYENFALAKPSAEFHVVLVQASLVSRWHLTSYIGYNGKRH